MTQFEISANEYLCNNTIAFYHAPYVGMGNPGNPNYVNDLKNTFNDFTKDKLISAAQKLQGVLLDDLPQILQSSDFEMMTVCVVPRAKDEDYYHANQLLFKSTVQNSINQLDGFEDGTSYMHRHTDTKTTHLMNPIRNHKNIGPEPFPGITAQTCAISTDVKAKNILLIDDIYTPHVNIDEDAIQALLNAGARTVIFYAVGKV